MGHLILYSGIGCVVLGMILLIGFLVLSKGTGKRLRRKLEEEYRSAT